jgi:multiple sugar transport system permease protein
MSADVSGSAAPRRNRKPARRLALVYAALLAWTLACVFPLYWIAVTSLKGEREIVKGPFYLPFIDFTPTLESWRFILRDASDNLLLEFFNSAVVALSSTGLTILLGALFVYGVTRFRFALRLTGILGFLLLAAAAGSALLGSFGPASLFAAALIALLFAGRWLRDRQPKLRKELLPILLIATRVLPPAVIVLPVYLMARQTGTLDTRLALVVAYTATNLPIAIWLLLPIFGRSATEQEEAAQLDGASQLRIFSTIVLPMLGAGLAAVAILIFVLAWNEYLFAAYLAADRAMTLPPWAVGQLSMKEAQVGGDIEEWSRLSAAIVLMVTPLLIGTVFVQRVLSQIGVWRRG